MVCPVRQILDNYADKFKFRHLWGYVKGCMYYTQLKTALNDDEELIKKTYDVRSLMPVPVLFDVRLHKRQSFKSNKPAQDDNRNSRFTDAYD